MTPRPLCENWAHAGSPHRARKYATPISDANSHVAYDAPKACDIKFFSALPETWLVRPIRFIEDDPDSSLVQLAKKEEGVGISVGCHLAGVKSVMLMQHHGQTPRFSAGFCARA